MFLLSFFLTTGFLGSFLSCFPKTIIPEWKTSLTVRKPMVDEFQLARWLLSHSWFFAWRSDAPSKCTMPLVDELVIRKIPDVGIKLGLKWLTICRPLLIWIYWQWIANPNLGWFHCFWILPFSITGSNQGCLAEPFGRSFDGMKQLPFGRIKANSTSHNPKLFWVVGPWNLINDWREWFSSHLLVVHDLLATHFAPLIQGTCTMGRIKSPLSLRNASICRTALPHMAMSWQTISLFKLHESYLVIRQASQQTHQWIEPV